MISTIHESTIVNKGKKDRKINVEIKKPMMLYSTINAYRAVDRADQYLTYYSVLKKTVKWSKKKGGTVSDKLCALQRIYCVQDAKKNSVGLVRERTIPTDRPPPVGEVSANFCG